MTRWQDSWPQPSEADVADDEPPRTDSLASPCPPRAESKGSAPVQGNGTPEAPIVIEGPGLAVDEETTSDHTSMASGLSLPDVAKPPALATSAAAGDADLLDAPALAGEGEPEIPLFSMRAENKSVSLGALGCGVVVGQETGVFNWDKRFTIDLGSLLVTLCGDMRSKGGR